MRGAIDGALADAADVMLLDLQLVDGSDSRCWRREARGARAVRDRTEQLLQRAAIPRREPAAGADVVLTRPRSSARAEILRDCLHAAQARLPN